MKAIKKYVGILCALSLIFGMFSGIGINAVKNTYAVGDDLISRWGSGSFLSAPQEECAIESKWTYDASTDSFTRTSQNSGWADHNVAMLYGNESYEDFVLEFDVKFSEQLFNEDGSKNGEPAIMLQFGNRTLGGAPQDEIATGGEIIELFNNYNVDDEIYKAYSRHWREVSPEGGHWSRTVSDIDPDVSHHVKLTVSNGKMSFSFDGTVIYDPHDVGTTYEGGYVGVGTGWAGTVISNIQLGYESPDTTFSAFSAYHADSTPTYYVQNTYQLDSISTDWQYLTGDMISPRSDRGGLKILYTENTYTDFEMEFDYITCDTLYIGFGAQDMGGNILTQGNLANPSPSIIRITTQGFGAYAPNTTGNDAWFGNDGGPLFDESQYYDIHSAFIKVAGGKMSLYIDGISRGTVTMNNYSGGHIFIMAYNANEAISLPVIYDADIDRTFADFTAYKAETDYNATFWQTGLTEQAKISDGWKYNSEGRISPNRDTNSNMSFLYTNQKYTNFEMTFEFTAGNHFYVGVGASEKGGGLPSKPISDPSSFSIRLRPAGTAQCAPIDENGNDGWPFNDSWRTEGQTSADVHICKILVNNGMMSLYIDGHMLSGRSYRLLNYEGGYIYFAASDSVESLSLPDIRSIDVGEDFNSEFTGYYSTTFTSVEIDNGGTTTVKTSPYWANSLSPDDDLQAYWYRDSDGMYTKSDSDRMSTLYMNDVYDQNFRMTINYNVPNSIGNYGIFIGFGNKNMGDDWFRGENTQTANIIRLFSSASAGFSPDSKNMLNDTYAMGASNSDFAGWDSSAVHTAVIEVKYDAVYVWLDGIYRGSAELACYEAGYIFIAAQTAGTKFAMPVIENINPEKYGSETSAAYRKSALFIGDSICDGAGDQAAWANRLGWHFDLDYTNCAHGGWVIADDAATGLGSIQTQLTDEAYGSDYDYVIVEGGINDIMQNVNRNSNYCKLGSVSDSYNIEDFDTTTAAGGLEAIFYNATYLYGDDTKLGFIMVMKPETNWIGDWETAELYVDTYLEICSKWNVAVLNLWDDEEVSTAFSENPKYYTDGLHPSHDGYSFLDSKFATWFNALEATGYAGCGYVNADGSIDLLDLICMKKLLAEAEVEYRYSADVTRDRTFDASDMAKMREYLLGEIAVF